MIERSSMEQLAVTAVIGSIIIMYVFQLSAYLLFRIVFG
jgi:hypothetical protein